MKILKCVFGLVLVSVLAGPYLHAQTKSPTLWDEVREKGVVWRISYPDWLFLASLDQMVSQSEIIFRGRVINEKTRLSADEDHILTEYTIEVSEVYKDSLQAATLGKTLVITKSGALAIENKRIVCKGQDEKLRHPITKPFCNKVGGKDEFLQVLNDKIVALEKGRIKFGFSVLVALE